MNKAEFIKFGKFFFVVFFSSSSPLYNNNGAEVNFQALCFYAIQVVWMTVYPTSLWSNLFLCKWLNTLTQYLLCLDLNECRVTTISPSTSIPVVKLFAHMAFSFFSYHVYPASPNSLKLPISHAINSPLYPTWTQPNTLLALLCLFLYLPCLSEWFPYGLNHWLN